MYDWGFVGSGNLRGPGPEDLPWLPTTQAIAPAKTTTTRTATIRPDRPWRRRLLWFTDSPFVTSGCGGSGHMMLASRLARSSANSCGRPELAVSNHDSLNLTL